MTCPSRFKVIIQDVANAGVFCLPACPNACADCIVPHPKHLGQDFSHPETRTIRGCLLLALQAKSQERILTPSQVGDRWYGRHGRACWCGCRHIARNGCTGTARVTVRVCGYMVGRQRSMFFFLHFLSVFWFFALLIFPPFAENLLVIIPVNN